MRLLSQAPANSAVVLRGFFFRTSWVQMPGVVYVEQAMEAVVSF